MLITNHVLAGATLSSSCPGVTSASAGLPSPFPAAAQRLHSRIQTQHPSYRPAKTAADITLTFACPVLAVRAARGR